MIRAGSAAKASSGGQRDEALFRDAWERVRVPEKVNGSRGTFRAPRRSCVLSANNDYEAVKIRLALQESATTQRVYRKDTESG